MSHRSILPALILCAAAMSGCEETVDPVLESGRPYTLYGYLSPGSARQAIRVFEIEGTLAYSEAAPLGAQVSSMGPAGEAVEWADSTVRYSDGTVGNVYWSIFTPEFAAVYSLQAVHENGQSSNATVRMPEEAEIESVPPRIVPGNVRMDVRFKNVEQLLQPKLVYEFESNAPPYSWRIPIAYDGQIEHGAGEWVMDVRLSRDIGTLYTLTGLRPVVNPLTLTRVTAQGFITTDVWVAPGDVFDPDVLVQPGTLSNVENGFGFVGAGYTAGRALELSDAAIETAGFELPADG